MPPFRRVDPERAGADALGILVPPGEKSFVILRPRGLPWDLLPARWDGTPERPPEFCYFGRDEAARTARNLLHYLEEQVGRTCPVETLGDAAGNRFQVWVRTPELLFVVCRRSPGQPYQPVVFPSRAEAESAGASIESVVWPAADAEQEYYFNTQRFAS